MKVAHPIPYQGSKRNLATQILAYFPEDATRLLEPFAGSAAVSLAALHYQKVDAVVLNDANQALMRLWSDIVNQPDKLSAEYRALWEQQQGQERIFYDTIRADFNKAPRPDYFLYLLARCVKAAVRYNAQGEFNQSPDNRRKGTHPDTMRQHVLRAAQLLKNRVSLHNVDYREVLNKATTADVVYLDPPYQGVTKSHDPRYQEKVSFDSFARALSALNNRNISYIVSYDGRTETKTYGEVLPSTLELVHIELNAGRSTQATLLGRQATTFESLYLSPALIARLPEIENVASVQPHQLELFETP